MTTTTFPTDRQRLVEARELNEALRREIRELHDAKVRIMNRDVLLLARTVRKLGDLPTGSIEAARALDQAFVLADRLAA